MISSHLISLPLSYQLTNFNFGVMGHFNLANKFPFHSPSPLPSLFKNSPFSSVNSTPLRIFKMPFPPPSPAKHIRALLARRHGSVKPNEASIPEGSECDVGLDKNFELWQMATTIAIEDVRREVNILRALMGHKNLVQFYYAFEDEDNVYIVME